jgi:hypothetical protein
MRDGFINILVRTRPDRLETTIDNRFFDDRAGIGG